MAIVHKFVILYAKYLQGTFILYLVQIGHVVSEEKSFEILLTTTTDDEDDGRQLMAIKVNILVFGLSDRL